MFGKNTLTVKALGVGVAGIFIGGAVASAADKNWVGTGSTLFWNTPTNWYTTNQPQSGDTAIIVNRGASSQTINFANGGLDITLASLNMSTESTGQFRLIIPTGSPNNLKSNYDWISSGGYGWITLRQEGNTHQVGYAMYLGFGGTNGKSIYELAGGTISNAGDAFIGTSNGRADFMQSGGYHGVNNLYLGSGSMNVQNLYSIYGGTLSANTLHVGSFGSAYFDHGAGKVNLTDSFYLGDGTGSYGYYRIYGGATLSGGAYTFIGNYGQGQLQMYGGDATLGSLFIGRNAGAYGTWDMDGGTLSDGLVIIGDSGAQGSFVQDGGKHTSNIVRIGGTPNSSGSYYLAPSGMHSVNQDLIVGSNGTGQYATAGSVSTGGQLIVGESGLGYGTYYQTAGTITVGSSTDIGRNGNGTFNLAGGIAKTGNFMRIGAASGGRGNLIITGGVVNAGTVVVGAGSGIGTITQSAGTFSTTGTLTVASGSLSSGTINLSGAGSFFRPQYMVLGENSGTGVFNQNGGFYNPFNRLTIGNRGTYNLSAGTFYGSITMVDGLYNQTGGWAGLGSTGGNGTIRVGNGTAYIFHANGQNMIDVRENGDVTISDGIPNVYGPSVVKSLAIAKNNTGQYTGSVDIVNDGLIIDYASNDASPFNEIKSMIKQGFHNGTWDGKGIRASEAATYSMYGIGYAEATDLFGTNFPNPTFFQNYPIDSTMVLVSYAYLGDADLNGKADIRDLYRLAAHWKSSDSTWFNGDFNYDGLVDAKDLGLLARNWQTKANLTTALASVGLGDVSVPEPSSTFAMLVMTGGHLIRRRKTDKKIANAVK